MTSLAKLAGSVIITTSLGIVQAATPTVTAMPGKPFLMLGNFDLAELGYITEEFALQGTATAYKLKAGSSYDAEATQTAPFTTRIVVVRPLNAAKFNGTVIVEWLNVTGGIDAPADWSTTHREIMRSGYAYVAVSAQKVGVEEGPNPMGGASYALKKIDPTRYAQLNHPGDAFSFDMYSQAGSALRGPDAKQLLGGLKAKRFISIGESQSAVFLSTYVNSVDAVAKVYDGFLIHSRFGIATPLSGAGVRTEGTPQVPAPLRPDLRVPVMTVVMETDVLGAGLLGFYGARQADTNKLRVWEVAGAAHADMYLMSAGAIDSGVAPIEKLAAAMAPAKERPGMKLDKPINAGPQQHYVMQAALSHLNSWLASGKAPPKGVPLQVIAGEPLKYSLDDNGHAKGGIRTPWVDVPTMRLSGVGGTGSLIAQLVGSSEPFDAATLQRLYPGGKNEYLKKFEGALSSAIAAGSILPADKQEILELARVSYPASP
jgi:hypothetical protein